MRDELEDEKEDIESFSNKEIDPNYQSSIDSFRLKKNINDEIMSNNESDNDN